MFKKVIMVSFLLTFYVLGIESLKKYMPIESLKEYMPNEFIKKYSPLPSENKPKGDQSSVPESKESSILGEVNLSETASIAFNTINNNDKNNDNPIIEPKSLEDLNVFSSPEYSNASLYNSVFDKCTFTTAAKAWAFMQLAVPIIDIKTLKDRQNIITSMPEQLNKQAVRIFQQIANYEQDWWKFWKKSPLGSSEKSFSSFNYFFPRGLTALNTSPFAAELVKYIGTGAALVSSAAPTINFLHDIKQDYYKTWPETFKLLIDYKNNNNLTLFATAPVLIGSYLLYGLYNKYKPNLLSLKDIHKSLVAVSNTLKEWQKLNKLITTNKKVLTLLPELKNVIDIFNPKMHTSSFNSLIALLLSSTFNEGTLLFFSLTGRVSSAYKLLIATKYEFELALTALAELETYIGLSNLYTKQTKRIAGYCLTEFVDNGPYLQAINFWNPLINNAKAITNSITLGREKPVNIILTGPNTAGKTTIIKALGQSIILAQTFGLAAAQSFTLAPFSKINSFMDILGNTAKGISLFDAEAIRASELLAQIKNLPHNKYVFTIMDEIFTSTQGKVGKGIAFEVTKNLGEYANGIFILATHYKRLTELPDTNSQKFANMHVEVIRNKDNSLTKTYKLKEGPSFMNIARDILKEKGITFE